MVIGILAATLLMAIRSFEQLNKAQDGGAISRCKNAMEAWNRVVVLGQTPAGCGQLITLYEEIKAGGCDGPGAPDSTYEEG